MGGRTVAILCLGEVKRTDVSFIGIAGAQTHTQGGATNSRVTRHFTQRNRVTPKRKKGDRKPELENVLDGFWAKPTKQKRRSRTTEKTRTTSLLHKKEIDI